jgi:outer membrane lipoprotein-sorting protein
VADLLSNRSRLRVWHADDERFRVDRLTTGAESDTYVYGNISLVWDSDQRTVVRSVGPSQLPLPRPPDVLPSQLGKRVVEQLPADGAGVRKAGTDRIAGRATVELRWQPHDPKSLVGDVRMWVDPTNGLPLRVQLRPVGSDTIAFETSFLDLKLGPPDAAALRFDVAGTPRADVQDTLAPSPGDAKPPYVLPQTLAGLPQRSGPAPMVSTYGRGTALVALFALDDATVDSLRSQIDSPGRPPIRTSFGEATAVEAPMLRALIFTSADRGYVLAGTVPLEVLESMGQELVDNPPDRTGT